MKPGDFVLEPPTDREGRAIASLAGGKYCHARLALEGDTTIEAVGDGVSIEPDVYEDDLAVSVPLSDAQRAALPAAAVEFLGLPYDTRAYWALGLAGIGWPPPYLRRDLGEPRAFTCAHFVVHVWREVGFDPFPGRRPQSITPGDLADVALREGWAALTL